MERLEIPHISYQVMWNKDVPYSVCEDFVTSDTELIPAWRIMQTQKKENNVSVYQHFLSCCEKLGIKDVVRFLDRMIVLDYIIANEDRHFNNFGVLRNAETLEWIGMAPIYDSGSSLGYDKMPAQIYAQKRIKDLFAISMDYTPSETISTDDDVEENIAEEYQTKGMI